MFQRQKQKLEVSKPPTKCLQTKSMVQVKKSILERPKSLQLDSPTFLQSKWHLLIPTLFTSPHHKASYDLPTFLLVNLQSIGISGEYEKSPELGKILELNNIDIACLTETWLSESNEDEMSFRNYYCFNLVRKNVRRASGGVSIVVKQGVPTNNLNINGSPSDPRNFPGLFQLLQGHTYTTQVLLLIMPQSRMTLSST